MTAPIQYRTPLRPHQPARLRPTASVRCTRMTWPDRIARLVIALSALYLALRIIPSLISQFYHVPAT
jgi:hypothetical protein